MATKRKFRSAEDQELYEELIKEDPEAREEIEEELVRIEAALQIYEMRKKVGLSPRELASRIGTSESVINRLECADYKGQTIETVRRIAIALNRHLDLRAVRMKAAPTKHPT